MQHAKYKLQLRLQLPTSQLLVGMEESDGQARKQLGSSASKPKQGKKSLTSRRTSAAAKHRQN